MPPQEIERKFTVHPERLPEEIRNSPLHGRNAVHIVQGYLARDDNGTVVRVRNATSKSETHYSVVESTMTVKGRGTLVRDEVNIKITWKEANVLLAMCSAQLTKRRFRVPIGDLVWEVDEFLTPLDGLWLAEVELKTPDAAVSLPEWIEREVTESESFSNYSLAQKAKDLLSRGRRFREGAVTHCLDLRAGHALCGAGMPERWSVGDVWVPADAENLGFVTCKPYHERLSAMHAPTIPA